MKAIKRIGFNYLRNNEHFQFQTEFKALVEEFNAQTLKIETLFVQTYLPLYNDEDEALVKIVKNSFSEARSEADRQRDSIFRGLDDSVKAALNHFDPEMQAAAKRIRIPLDTFGNVAQLPLNEETSAIYNLVQELRANYAAELTKLALAAWVDKLEADNKAYEELVKSSYEEDAAKTELKAKEVRIAIDATVRKIFERIEALMLIEGEQDYTEFVRRLNMQIEKYDNTLAQRRGAAKAKKEI